MLTEATQQTASVRVPFAALILAMLPAVLDQTILATALPTIASDLGSLTDVSWLVTAYVVSATASTPLWGKLGDRHGRRRLLLGALSLFLIASAACGFAQSLTELIVTRGIQGIGAGGLMTLAMASVGDLVSPRERGRYQGYIMAAFAGATVLGPLLGGLLVDHASWRWVFYVNLPVGVAAMFSLSATLPAGTDDRPQPKLDVTGAALLSGATVALMLTCLWGGARFAWTSAPIVGLGVATLALAGLLVARERRAEDPIVPLAMLKAPAVAVSSVALFLATASLFSITVFVPLFLQAVTGASPTAAGLLLVPMMAGTTLSTILSGSYIARTGRYKRFPIAGLALMTTGLALLAALAPQGSAALTLVALTVFGLGFGMVGQVLIVAVQNSVERTQLGTATAATAFFRALGGAVGAAALGTIFQAHGGNLADAVQIVFTCAAPLSAIALLVVLRLPEVELRRA
jgi:EmrB/QacA subfamily drug resistance transporter